MESKDTAQGRGASSDASVVPLGQLLQTGWATMFSDWRAGWMDVLHSKSFGSDLLAGLTVAAVALPLNVALAVAADLPPTAGLIAGAVGGALAAIFAGAPLQATGPAAALNVMVLALMHKFGPAGVAAAALVVGVIEIAMGLGLQGRWAARVPEAVLAGFTTGVGLKLLDQQIPEVLGFDYRVLELAQMMHRPAWLHHVQWIAVICGLTVAFLVVTTRQYKRFPAAIVGIAVATFIATYLHWNIERVGAVAASIPRPSFPVLRDEQWIDLLAAAAPLGILAAVESLLSARAVDRMVPTSPTHNPNLELVGQGIANIGVGLLSGMPVTGVIVRSGVNVQSGAKTRFAALIHALVLGGSVLFLGRYIREVPLAALAGLLCVVGFRLVELSTLAELVRHDKMDALAFVVTAAGTVSGHLMSGLVAGLVLHAIGHYLGRGAREEAAAKRVDGADGVRAVLGTDDAHARRPATAHELPSASRWVGQIRARAEMARSAFVHGNASVIGRVVLGEHVHIAAGSSVRADEGTPFFIGANSNIQDGVVIHALKNKHVRVAGEDWAVYVGRNVSMAHNALVHGPCYIGDDTFVGFKAVVHDSVVGKGCYIGIGAVVVGVEVPDGRFVPHGAIVKSADDVEALGPVTHAHREFNEDVVDVNRGLAAAYRHLESDRKVTAPPARAERRESETWEPSWNPSTDPDRF